MNRMLSRHCVAPTMAMLMIGCGAASEHDSPLPDEEVVAVSTDELGAAPWILFQGERLLAGQSMPTNGGHGRLVLQTDGNLVLYTNDNRALWATDTQGSGATHLVMQSDCNLVLRRANNTPVWWTNTTRKLGTACRFSVGSRPIAGQTRFDLVVSNATQPNGTHWRVVRFSN